MNIKNQVTEFIIEAIEEVKERWAFRQHLAYLKKMGWTEEVYQKQTDPRVNRSADRVNDYFHGYPYKHIFESARLSPFTKYDTWTAAYQAMNSWCQENCVGHWREDILRIYKQTGLKQVGDQLEWVELPEYFINDISGSDALFYAFENDKDYNLFLLKWA